MYTALAGRDLLSIADLSRADIDAVLDVGARAKAGHSLGRPLEGRCVAMIFQRPSNRTRVSFEVAIHRLGGHPIPIFSQEIQMGERESVADVSRILDRYLDGIVARLTSHRDLTRMATSARAPVVNAMTDREHPCQVLADLLTVREATGGLQGVPVAYVGDGNNVCNSLIYLAARLGVHLRIATPAEYAPAPEVVGDGRRVARETKAKIELMTDPREAVSGAMAVYTDSWTSMGFEAEEKVRNAVFAPYQVNAELMSLAAPDAAFLHCLPAHRGLEVTPEVLDGPSSVVLDQSENRMYVQKAILHTLF
jgi:ornithine carbamoyltransferase